MAESSFLHAISGSKLRILITAIYSSLFLMGIDMFFLLWIHPAPIRRALMLRCLGYSSVVGGLTAIAIWVILGQVFEARQRVANNLRVIMQCNDEIRNAAQVLVCIQHAKQPDPDETAAALECVKRISDAVSVLTRELAPELLKPTRARAQGST
jgi:hypothetical protein